MSKIAVLHNDTRVIVPVIDKLRDRKLSVIGPYPVLGDVVKNAGLAQRDILLALPSLIHTELSTDATALEFFQQAGVALIGLGGGFPGAEGYLPVDAEAIAKYFRK